MSVADSKKAQQTLKAHAANMAKLRAKDLYDQLSTPYGRRFVYGLIQGTCGVFSRSYTGNSDTYFREGRRSVGIDLMELIQKEHPEKWMLITQEQMALAQREKLNEVAAEVAAKTEEEDGL